MRLSRGRGLAVAGGNVPLHDVGVGLDLQGVEVVQVSGDVVLGVLTVVGEPSKQIDFVPDDCEAVAQSGTGRRSIARRLWFELLPLPPRGLKLEQVVTVLPVLDHPTEHQDPRPVHHKPKGGAAWGDVPLDWRDKPLVGRWKKNLLFSNFCNMKRKRALNDNDDIFKRKRAQE